jgi:hypothetical protein
MRHELVSPQGRAGPRGVPRHPEGRRFRNGNWLDRNPARNRAARWAWGIDTVLPKRELESGGYGIDRKDCQRRFKAAREAFSADPARLTEFMAMKRKRR